MKSGLLRPLRYEVPCVLADFLSLYLPHVQIKRLDDLSATRGRRSSDLVIEAFPRIGRACFDLIDTRNAQRSGRGEVILPRIHGHSITVINARLPSEGVSPSRQIHIAEFQAAFFATP